MQTKYDEYKKLIGEISDLNEQLKEKRKKVKTIEDEFEDYLRKNGQSVLHFSDGSFTLKKIEYKVVPKNSSQPLKKNE